MAAAECAHARTHTRRLELRPPAGRPAARDGRVERRARCAPDRRCCLDAHALRRPFIFLRFSGSCYLVPSLAKLSGVKHDAQTRAPALDSISQSGPAAATRRYGPKSLEPRLDEFGEPLSVRWSQEGLETGENCRCLPCLELRNQRLTVRKTTSDSSGKSKPAFWICFRCFLVVNRNSSDIGSVSSLFGIKVF